MEQVGVVDAGTMDAGIAQVCATAGDPKYRPAPMLRRYVDAGWLGRKCGRGFFTYGAA